jgi:hypothetical protein
MIPTSGSGCSAIGSASFSSSASLSLDAADGGAAGFASGAAGAAWSEGLAAAKLVPHMAPVPIRSENTKVKRAFIEIYWV